MSLTVNLNAIDWNMAHQCAMQSDFTTLNVHVPKEDTGRADSIEGKFHVSRSGLVYSHTSNSTLWLKFLGLATILTLDVALQKCQSLARKLFGGQLSPAKMKEHDHTAKLAAIARRAVVYKGGHPLIKRVEEFALAEINYNKGSKTLFQELKRPRSERLSENYQARCMQPLFHVSQASSTYQDVAQRCKKYATNAILYQRGCVTGAYEDMCVETQHEIEGVGVMCYKQQKVCGLIYKIDCCALRCWAAKLGCCFCCLWPAGTTNVCVL